MCSKIDHIYKDQVLGTRRLRPKADPECDLHGFWGEDLHSMASQGSFLGIPSFQFEMEQEIRAQLATDENIQKQWAKAIVQLYQEIIVPYWSQKQTPTKLNPKIASKVTQ